MRLSGGQEAPVYYAANGTAFMKHFEHGLLTGPCKITEKGYRVDWDKGVGTMEWELGYKPGEITYLDITGTPPATLVRIAKCDSENLSL